MHDLIRFAILGLGVGAVYVLIAHGVVLIYRGSGLLNFAQGAIAMVAAQVFYGLESRGVPIVVGLPTALVSAGLIGAAMQGVILRNMRHASGLARLVATLGLLILLAGIGQLAWGTTNRPVDGLLPDEVVDFGFGVVGTDRLLLLALAVVLTVVLSYVYGRTRFGLATSAVAESQRAATVLGWSPDAISLINWMTGSVLAGVAGILLAPLSGLTVHGLVFMVIPALAAALVGQFSSFWLTLTGGLVIGVAQAEVTRYVEQPGWSDAIPFLVVTVLMVIRGRSLPLRGEPSEQLVRAGLGTVRPLFTVVVVSLGLLLLLVSGPDWQLVLSTTAISGIIALSMVVVTGYAGQLSLAQLMMAGVGAVAAANASTRWGWSFPACVLFGALAATLVGVVVAIPALRVRGVNLAVVTLGLSVVIQQFLVSNGPFTPDGNLTIGAPSILGLDMSYLRHPERYALMTVLAFVVAALAVANIRRGASGRRYLALRSSERAASSCGVNIFASKVFAFSISSFLAGTAGAMSAYQFPYVNVAQFDPLNSINLLVQNMIGGIGYVGGALFAGTAVPGGAVSHIFKEAGIPAEFILVFGGVLVLFTIWHDPHGISDTVVRAVGPRLWRIHEAPVRRSGAKPTLDHPSRDYRRTEPRELTVAGLSVRFGGVHAVRDVSFVVRPGEVVGLIGPNGAGKTTILDAISGMVTSSGVVSISSRAIDSMSPGRRSGAGLARTFQAIELFDDLTVLDNLRVAAEGRHHWTHLTDVIRPRQLHLPPMAEMAIYDLDLVDDLRALAGHLSPSKQKLVGMARALATSPSVLLLDEPAAGMSAEESRELGDLVRRLALEWKLAVVLIEHDVELVMSVSDRVVALALGQIVTVGAPKDVMRDPDVLASYLGEEEPNVSGNGNEPTLQEEAP